MADNSPPSVQASIVNELRAAGMNDNAIRGILANVKDESGFNPGLRHPDQPKWGGEAHFAHGLYQEGGQEWNNYASWLKQNAPNADWRDPQLQTRFLAQNLKENYAPVWARMNNGTPEQAAQTFVSGYLKPAENFRLQRVAAYGRGVPDLDHFLNGSPVSAPSASPVSQAMISAIQGTPTAPTGGVSQVSAPTPPDTKTALTERLMALVGAMQPKAEQPLQTTPIQMQQPGLLQPVTFQKNPLGAQNG